MEQSQQHAPGNCLQCHGEADTYTVIRKFEHTDYGHLACKRCGITFDSNVNEYLDLELAPEDIQNITDEGEYRRLFIETSKIASDDGVVYSDFGWEDNEGVKSGIVQHVYEPLARYLNTDTPLRIIDLGCGNGFTTVELSKRLETAEIIGIDPSPEVTKVDGVNGIRTMQGTLDGLRFPDASKDAVIIIGNLMLHYNPAVSLKEAARILKPGGLLIIDFKNVESLIRKICRALSKIGMQGLIPRKILERSFVNMRYGYSKEYVSQIANDLELKLLESYSKPPRLLEFSNKSSHQAGLKGVIWRILDKIDSVRDERAWTQMIFSKPSD